MLDIMFEPETTSKLDIVMSEPDPSTKTSSETSDEILLSENSSLPNLEEVCVYFIFIFYDRASKVFFLGFVPVLSRCC